MNSRRLEVTTEDVRQAILASVAVQKELADNHVETIVRIVGLFIDVFRRGGQAVLFGNGGSAADAQHVASEFVGRLTMERDALPAIALTTDTSILTSIANDITFDQVFARQVRALVRHGDIAVGISTSGTSANVLNGLIAAREKGGTTVGFTGRDGTALKRVSDIVLCVPSDNTQRIQEAHITAWHAICEAIEQELFNSRSDHQKIGEARATHRHNS